MSGGRLLLGLFGAFLIWIAWGTWDTPAGQADPVMPGGVALIGVLSIWTALSRR